MTDETQKFPSEETNRQADSAQSICLRLYALDSHIDDKTASALVNHLIDLDILSIASNVDSFKWSDDEMERYSIKIIEASSRKRYLNFFLREPAEISTDDLLGFSSGLVEKKKARTHLFSRKKNISDGKQTSDLSNVQIVKKMESQLKPFLDMEKILIPQLLGERVNKEDAQCLFNFIMSKLREKVPSREWEQLSRRRHQK